MRIGESIIGPSVRERMRPRTASIWSLGVLRCILTVGMTGVEMLRSGTIATIRVRVIAGIAVMVSQILGIIKEIPPASSSAPSMTAPPPGLKPPFTWRV